MSDLGFTLGFPLYEMGEEARKKGDLDKAIYYFEEAKKVGYTYPALYQSYAMALRKMNDLPAEIAIIEEGIRVLSNSNYGDCSTTLRVLQDRLVKAQKLLKGR